MPKMKDSGIEWIGEIPNGWNVCKMKYCLDRNDGGVWGQDPIGSEQDKTVLRSTEQTIDGRWNINNPAIRNIGANCQQYKIKRGDLLITKSSGSSMHIGKTTLADGYFDENECYYSNFLQRLRVNKNIIPKYLWYLMNNSTVREQFVFMQNSTIGIGNINADNINAITIPIPSIDEQESIIVYLDEKCTEIDSLSADIEKEIETLEEYKKSVITEAVTKGLDPNAEMKDSGIEWIGKMPKNWDLKKITYILDKTHPYAFGDGDHGTIKADEYLDEGIPYIRVQNVNWCSELSLENVVYISEEQNRKIQNSTLRPNDILYVKTGATIGKTGIIPNSISIANTTSHVGKITVDPKHNPKYILYALSSYVGYKQMWDIASQKTTRPELSIEEAKTLKLLIPKERGIQDDIVKHLDNKCKEIDLTILEKKQQLETLVEYKKSLIYEYVTGKKEVPSEKMAVVDETDRNVVLLGLIADKLGELQSGRIQLQKVHFMMSMYVMMSQKTQYYRYNHGPYDICLNDYINVLLKSKWYQEKKDGAYTLVKGEKHPEFLSIHKDLIEKLAPEVDELISLLKSMNVLKTSRIERIATLYAAWNDLLLDEVSPTDDQIIKEVMNNWTGNKGNTQYATWQDSLDKMKKNGLVPKGTGKHTLPKQQ